MPAGTITDLVLQQGDQQRVNVFIDGVFAIGVSLVVVQDLRLHKGQQLSPADWERLEAAEQHARAWNTALALLSRRARTERELRERLRKKGFADAPIDAVVRRLRELELIDDAQFARQWIATRQHLRPRGALALRQELRAHGLAPQIVEQALSEQIDAESERHACARVARSVLRRYAGEADWPSFQRKLGSYLLRRGFTFETIKPILAELWRELRAAQ